jgi:hypothetical protein
MFPQIKSFSAPHFFPQNSVKEFSEKKNNLSLAKSPYFQIIPIAILSSLLNPNYPLLIRHEKKPPKEIRLAREKFSRTYARLHLRGFLRCNHCWPSFAPLSFSDSLLFFFGNSIPYKNLKMN